LSAAQLKHLDKRWRFSTSFSIIRSNIRWNWSAGAAAEGTAANVNAVKNVLAQNAAEAERHN